jgi:hypothetical protein
MADVLEVIISAKDDFSKTFSRITSSITPLKVGLASLATAAAALAGGAGIAALTKAAADDMDQMSKLQDRLGVTTETMSKLTYAANLADVSFEELKTSLQFMLRNTAEAAAGNEGMRQTLDRLGIAFEKIKNQSPDEMFYTYAKALEGIENPAEKARIATELFGRSGAVMLQMLKDGTGGLAELSKEAERFGAIISQQAAYNAAEFNDSLTRIGSALKGVRNALVEQFLPYLTGLFKTLAYWIADNRQAIVTWAINWVKSMAEAARALIQFGARAVDIFNYVNAAMNRDTINKNSIIIKTLVERAQEYGAAVEKIQGDLGKLEGKADTAWGRMQIKAASESLVYYQGKLDETTAEILKLNNENQKLAEGFSASDWFSEGKARAFFDEIERGIEKFKELGTAEIKPPKATPGLSDTITDKQRSEIEQLKQMWLEYYGTDRQRLDAWYAYSLEKYKSLKGAQELLSGIYEAKQLEIDQKLRDSQTDYLKSIESQYEGLYSKLDQNRISEVAKVDTWYMEQLEAHGAYEENRLAIENLYREKRKLAMQEDTTFEAQQQADRLNIYANFLGGMAALAGSMGKKMFVLQKALNIGQAVMSTFAGAANALKDYPYPYNIVAAGAVIAFGLAQVAKIASQKPPEAHTGLDYVPREQTYMLSKGERVVQPGANEDLTAFLANAQAGGGGAGGSLTIEKLEVFPNVTTASALKNMDSRELEEVLEEKFYPAMRRLAKAGISA